MTIETSSGRESDILKNKPVAQTAGECLNELDLPYPDSDASFASLAEYEADGYTLPPDLIDALINWAIASLRGGSFDLAMIHFVEQHTQDGLGRLNDALVIANDKCRISALPPSTQGVKNIVYRHSI